MFSRPFNTTSKFHRVFIRNFNIPINEVRRGQVLKHKNRIKIVSEPPKLVTQGRRGSHYNVELKDIESSSKIIERFNSGSSIESVDLSERKLQFLYEEGNILTLVDTETYEEVNVPSHLITQQQKNLLNSDMVLNVQTHNDVPLNIVFPNSAVYTVIETSPPLHAGDTKTNMSKSAQIDTGASVQVPEHVQQGDRIVLNLEKGTYLQKQK